MIKRIFSVSATVLFSVLVASGIVYAATRNITSTLGGASGDIFEVSGGFKVSSLTVGAQGTGGVTFFNGTIVNNTTTSGADNPVTFGDNVRIDGRIYRGATAGTSDTLPVIINDNLQVSGSLTVASIVSSGVVTSANIADGAVATADLASGAVTQAVENNTSSVTTTKSGNGNYDIATQVQITTGSSKLFCMFNGYGSINTPDTTMSLALVYDGSPILNSYREATIGHNNVGHVILATSAIIDATAGTHTVQLGWNTSAGTTATIYFDTLDCLELKK